LSLTFRTNVPYCSVHPHLYNYADGSKGNTYVFVDGESENITIGNNLIYNDNGVQPAGDPFAYDLWMIDPQFIDFDSSDYRLMPTSSAIDAGVDVGVITDLEGNPRPQCEGFDLGAYEYADLPKPAFVDVPFDYWAYDEIEALYQEGYVAGCSTEPLMYCPEQIMTRAESAVFVEHCSLERWLHLGMWHGSTDLLPSAATHAHGRLCVLPADDAWCRLCSTRPRRDLCGCTAGWVGSQVDRSGFQCRADPGL